MDLTDFFGHMSKRPDHPDLWKLSEVLLHMDSGMEPHVPEEEKQALWNRRIAEAGIDPTVVTYSSMQRVFRMLNIETNRDLLPKAEQAMALASAWLDGFIAGSMYATKQAAEECPFDCDACHRE